MHDIRFSLKVLISTAILLAIASQLPPWKLYWVDLWSLILVYAWMRFRGIERLWWMAVLLAAIGIGQSLPLREWGSIGILLASAVLFNTLFKRVYIESYALEAVYVGGIVSLMTWIKRLLIYGNLSLHTAIAIACNFLITIMTAFILFIALDLLFHRSHALWRKV